MTPAEVDVVLPCLNEATGLPAVLGPLPAGYRAVVVDNGSTDGSATVAAGLGADVVTEPRRGYGAACAAGLARATLPWCCFADCDGSLDLAELPPLVALVRGGEADLVLGARRPASRGAMSLHARVANRSLSRQIRRATGLPLSDLGPLRVGQREALIGLGITDRRSGYPLETVLRAAAAGWRVREVPVSYAPRIGRSKVTGTVRGTVTAVRDMRRAFRDAARQATLPAGTVRS